MTTSIEDQLLCILRVQARSGTGRAIMPDETLSGAGIDSLTLISFLTAVEKEFGVELPDELWTHKDSLTIQRFAEHVRAHSAAGASVADARHSLLHQQHPDASAASPSRGDHAQSPMSHRFASSASYFILARELTNGDLPSTAPLSSLRFRQASPDDARSLAGFWPAGKQQRKEQRFIERLAAGYIGLTAWSGSEIVGIDWVSACGDFEPNTNLHIATLPGTAYGFDLYEKYEGKGIGYALLCLSLEECLKRGFSRQVTIVSEKNVRMMTVSTLLAGYAVAGKITSLRIGKRVFSSWKVNGIRGRGRMLAV